MCEKHSELAITNEDAGSLAEYVLWHARRMCDIRRRGAARAIKELSPRDSH